MKPTCSSASKSALYWAMSSGGLFWTRLRHSSQMAKPAMNMPMSGMNTRMPLPASAPMTLKDKQKTQEDTHSQKAGACILKGSLDPSIHQIMWRGFSLWTGIQMMENKTEHKKLLCGSSLLIQNSFSANLGTCGCSFGSLGSGPQVTALLCVMNLAQDICRMSALSVAHSLWCLSECKTTTAANAFFWNCYLFTWQSGFFPWLRCSFNTCCVECLGFYVEHHPL